MRSLIRQVQTLAEQHQAVLIEEIEAEVGPLSGVEPVLLQSAFERLKDAASLGSAVLMIRQVELRVVCGECQSESSLPDFHFVCPACGSQSLSILQGDEFRLLNIRLQVRDDEAHTASNKG